MEDDEDPGEAHDDHREAHQRGVAEESRSGNVAERVENHGQLQADEDEEERVQRVLDDLPDRKPLETHLRGRELGRVPAEVHPRAHGCEHRRNAQQLGRDEREVPRHE